MGRAGIVAGLLSAGLLSCTLVSGGCAAPAGGGADLEEDAVLGRYDWRTPAARWTLPDELDEVSGLAADGRGGLFTHDDNHSAVWRLRLAPTFEARPLPGPGPVIDGDFEGITRQGADLLLLTSPGVLFRVTLGSGAERIVAGPAPLPARTAGRCGFEGVAAAPDGALYLACKYPRDPQAGHVLLLRLEPDGSVQPVPVDVGGVLAALGLRRLRPSGLAWHDAAGRLLVLAGKERVLLEVDPVRGLVAWRRLASALHRQAEGLALLEDGGLAVADEADGRRATLTLYRVRQAEDGTEAGRLPRGAVGPGVLGPQTGVCCHCARGMGPARSVPTGCDLLR